MKSHTDLPEKMSSFDAINPSTGLDVVGDRFELLSAYLDGEVNAQQRQQVQSWLEDDPEMQELHRRLLSLRQNLQSLPVPESSYSSDDLIAGVFAAEEKRQGVRWLVWGSGAIAAVAIGAVSLVLNPGGLSPRFAQQAEPEREKLMIAVNQPVVNIPVVEQPNIEAELLIPIDRPVVDIPVVDQ